VNREKNEENGLSRRDFGRTAALGMATAVCVPGELAAHIISPISPEALPPNANNRQQHAALSAGSQAEVDEKVQAILRKYGDRLSDAQKADIRRLVTEGQAPLEKMRAFPLDNGDQPGNVLRLFPDGKEFGAEKRRTNAK
jgi:hypothetical protein